MSPKLVQTYPHMVENHGITYLIFDIDIMKKSFPLNLKFTFFATVKTKIPILFSVTQQKTAETIKNKTFMKDFN